jgi:hypothetical protein
MAFTSEQLSPYFAQIEIYRSHMEPNFSLAYDYLSGKLDQLPAFTSHYENSRFGNLFDLTLQPGILPQNMAMLHSFFNDPNISGWVGHVIAAKLFMPILKTNDQAAFDKAMEAIQKISLTTDNLFYFFLYNGYFSKDEIMNGALPVLNFMHEHLSKMPEADLNYAIQHSPRASFDWRLFHFLYKNRKEKAYEYVESWFFVEGGKVNQVTMKTVLEVEFEKYGPRYVAIAEDLRSRNKIKAGFNTYLLYNDFSKYNDIKELLIWSEAYFEFYINKIEEYEEGFASTCYRMDDEEAFYMPLHGWALFFILTVDEDAAKEMLARLTVLKTEVLKMLKHVMEAGAIPWLLNAVFQKDNKYNDRGRLEYIFNELAGFKGQFDMNILWQFEKYQTKQAEQLVINFLAAHDSEVIAKAVKAIDDKRKDVRLTAVRILLALDAPEAIAPLKNALDKETDDTTRDLIWQICGRELAAPVTESSVAAMVEGAKKRGKLKKSVFTWLDETTLPGLYFQSGRQLNAEEVRLVLYRMSRAKGMRTDAEIKPVLQLIDRERSADFAKAVYKAFEEKQFDSKYKFLLLLAALFGNDDMVNKFCSAINKWIDDSRKVMCEYGIEALALQGSNKALRWIEWYSRKYRNKKTYISEAAFKALTAAAEELEISTHELGDRIVPDFGFDGLFKHFTINGEEYRAFVDSNFKLAYFNEDNKKLKSLPAAADKEIAAEFKGIAKEVRDVVKAQSSRLEHYLIVQRKWAFAEWQQFYLNNPIMFIYATKLLWGVYDKGNKLVSCFLCQEDTTLVDKEGNETEAPEEYFVGIVHPISLSPDELQSWKRQFFDGSIEPVFPQLERPVHFIANEDREKRVVRNFVDVPTDSGSIKNTLDRYGWRKGDTGDGGFINTFHYLDHGNRIEAELEVDGVLVYGFDDNATLGQLFFVDTSVKRTYNSGVTNTDRDERLIQLGKLSPVFYSEVITAIKAIKTR